MKTIFVGFIVAFLIAAISVGSAGYVPDGHVELNVRTLTGGYEGVFVELPENFTRMGDLNYDGRRDGKDVVIAQRLLRTGEYMLAADMNLDGVHTSYELRNIGSSQTFVALPVCRTYWVGDHNGDGVVYKDWQDYLTTWTIFCGNLPYSELADFDLDGVIDIGTRQNPGDVWNHWFTYCGKIPEQPRTTCV